MKHIQKAALVLASAGFAKAFVAPRINTATFCSAMSASSFYVSGYNACNPCLVPSLLDFSTNSHMCHSSSYLGQLIHHFMLQDLSGVKSDGSTLDASALKGKVVYATNVASR